MKKISLFMLIGLFSSIAMAATPATTPLAPAQSNSSHTTETINLSAQGQMDWTQIVEITGKTSININVADKKNLSSQVVSMKDAQGMKHKYQIFQYSATKKPLTKEQAKKILRQYQSQQLQNASTMNQEMQMMDRQVAQMQAQMNAQMPIVMPVFPNNQMALMNQQNCRHKKHHGHIWWRYWLHRMFG